MRRAIQETVALCITFDGPSGLLAPSLAEARGAVTVDDAVRCAQELRRFEDHLDNMTVAVRLRRLAGTKGKEEQIHVAEVTGFDHSDRRLFFARNPFFWQQLELRVCQFGSH